MRQDKIKVIIGNRGAGKTSAIQMQGRMNRDNVEHAFITREKMFEALMKEWGFGIANFIHYKDSIFHFHQKRVDNRYYVVQVDLSDYKHVRIGFMRSLSASCAEKFIKENPFVEFDNIMMVDGMLIEGFAEKIEVENKKILVYDINSDFYAKK